MNREKQLRKEIEEREKSGVSEEHTGHWSYDDYLKAELKGILSERKRILEILRLNIGLGGKIDVTFEELKKEIEDGR